MGFGTPYFVLAIIAIVFASGIITTWIKAKHGYPPRRSRRGHRFAQPDDLPEARQIELLSHENADLKGKIGRLEERIAVLERIATDPAERTAREIDDLR